MTAITQGPIHCACVIHGTGYSWDYVDRLYNMLSRHLTNDIVMHVYTEPDRAVPDHMIKHQLEDLGVTGPKKSWWYKLQLFNNKHYHGPLLYFDLDTVIVDSIDWITQQSLQYFWAPRDFKYLWDSCHSGVNSSVMWWDTDKFVDVWNHFKQQNFHQLQRQYAGDQDFLNDAIDQSQRRFLDQNLIKSWKWECVDGGYDFQRRQCLCPGIGTQQNFASVMVFHGRPKPHEITDNIITSHWK